MGGRETRTPRDPPPHGVCKIVGDQQSTGTVDRQTNRPSARLIFRIEEAGDDVLRRAAGLSAAKRHEYHLVAVKRASIQASVFAYERGAAADCGKHGASAPTT